MYTVWHVDKYKITFKLVINWTNGILHHIVISSGLSRPGIIDARARYRAAARRLRNTDIKCLMLNARQIVAIWGASFITGRGLRKGIKTSLILELRPTGCEINDQTAVRSKSAVTEILWKAVKIEARTFFYWKCCYRTGLSEGECRLYWKLGADRN
jgi:hypothetical protein